jgi:O-acetylserine/cysteine efflux transporter
MKPIDVSLAVMVAVIWGLAFVASRIALDEFSPELMTALRFAIAALPCLLVPRPKVSRPVLIAINATPQDAPLQGVPKQVLPKIA